MQQVQKIELFLLFEGENQILEYSQEYPNSIINSSSLFYGACRHKFGFYREHHTTFPTSADDYRTNSERVSTQDLNNPSSLIIKTIEI